MNLSSSKSEMCPSQIHGNTKHEETSIKGNTHLTFLGASVGIGGADVDLRLRGLPGPRRAGLREVSSFL